MWKGKGTVDAQMWTLEYDGKLGGGDSHMLDKGAMWGMMVAHGGAYVAHGHGCHTSI